MDQDVAGPPEAGPLDNVDDKGRFRPSDGDLLFRPPTWIFTLRTHRGCVKWAVLDWQAEAAIAMLGFPQKAPPAAN